MVNIKASEEKEPILVQEEAKEENEFILDVKEKEIE